MPTYTAPTTTPSGATFANLRAGGFSSLVGAVAASSGRDPYAFSHSAGPSSALQAFQGAGGAVDLYCSGEPVSQGDTLSVILGASVLLHLLAEALDEAGALVAANPGTVAGSPPVRTF